MNGIHDMGGMHGFGPVVPERDEPVFHAEWERRMFALTLAVMGRRAFNVDEFRRTVERMPPRDYLRASYYERWLYALETLLIEKSVVARTEVDIVMAAVRAGASPAKAPPRVEGDPGSSESAHNEDTLRILSGGVRDLRHDQSHRPRFVIGDRVIARTMNPEGHTRIPRYVRGHHGVIHRDWGVFIFPDTHAHGQGANPQHCYAVEFEAREVWGSDRQTGDRIYVDLWEDYLEAVVLDAKPQTARKAKTGSAANTRTAKPARSAMKTASKPGGA